jgi:uncharacterized integral membrane protein
MTGEHGERGGGISPKAIGIVVLLVLCFILIIQNTQVVTIRLFFWKLSMSQIILMPLALLAGFVIGVLTQAHFSKRREKRLSSVEMPML